MHVWGWEQVWEQVGKYGGRLGAERVGHVAALPAQGLAGQVRTVAAGGAAGAGTLMVRWQVRRSRKHRATTEHEALYTARSQSARSIEHAALKHQQPAPQAACPS